jgi:hypothetical protein
MISKKLKNSQRFIKMAKQITKMTESRRVVAVRGGGDLDWGSRVNASTQVNTGCAWVRPTRVSARLHPARGSVVRAPGLVGDRLTDATDGPMSPILDDVYHLYIYL